MINRLKERNRTVLELDLGILLCGLICQLAGMWLVGQKGRYTVALWLGIGLALIAVRHMHRTLDRALDLGDGAARVVVINNMLRYAVLIIILGVVMVTDVLNPLIVFLGCMMLKVAAYLQPFTHKFCNKVFHETDPVPEPIPEEDSEGAEPELLK